MWIIFDWGGCYEVNQANPKANCMGSDTQRGLLGWAFELCPGLLESLIFALLLVAFHALATALTSWFNYRTEEGADRCFTVRPPVTPVLDRLLLTHDNSLLIISVFPSPRQLLTYSLLVANNNQPGAHLRHGALRHVLLVLLPGLRVRA